MRSARCSRIERVGVPPALVRELALYNLRQRLAMPVRALGALIGLWVRATALSSFWGLRFSESFAVAAVIESSGFFALGFGSLPSVVSNLLPESPIDGKALKRVAFLLSVATASLMSLPLTAALAAFLAWSGFMPWSWEAVAALAALSLMPMVPYRVINTLLYARLLEVIAGKLRLYGSWEAPAAPREYARLLLNDLWHFVVSTTIFVLTPLYFPLTSLPLPLQVAAALLNPYALSMEAARGLALGLAVPGWVLPAALAVSLFWASLVVLVPDLA